MKKLGLIVATLIALTATGFAAEEVVKKDESATRKTFVDKCTKEGHTGKKLDECVTGLEKAQAEKPAAKTGETQKPIANQ